MRPIDADAMLEYLDLMYDKQEDWREPYNVGVLGAINYIKHKAPTIDAVSVVRCKECKYKYQEPWHNGIRVEGECEIWQRATLADDFCSYGEREGE